MKIIEERWAKFRAAVMPPGASSQQEDNLRVAFVAGMLSLDAAMSEIAEINDEDGAVAALTSLKNELMAEVVTYTSRGKGSH